ncbi:hypothetical protein [Geopseudomonas aromaticivorans]
MNDPIPDIPLNAHGVPQYPKGHAGRLLVVLAAIDRQERPTASSVAALTGLSKGGIDKYVWKLNAELGTTIVKNGPVYQIKAWGDLLEPEGVRKKLVGSVKQN